MIIVNNMLFKVIYQPKCNSFFLSKYINKPTFFHPIHLLFHYHANILDRFHLYSHYN